MMRDYIAKLQTMTIGELIKEKSIIDSSRMSKRAIKQRVGTIRSVMKEKVRVCFSK